MSSQLSLPARLTAAVVLAAGAAAVLLLSAGRLVE